MNQKIPNCFLLLKLQFWLKRKSYSLWALSFQFTQSRINSKQDLLVLNSFTGLDWKERIYRKQTKLVFNPSLSKFHDLHMNLISISFLWIRKDYWFKLTWYPKKTFQLSTKLSSLIIPLNRKGLQMKYCVQRYSKRGNWLLL